MKKRIFPLLLSFALLLSAASCGGGQHETSDGSKPIPSGTESQEDGAVTPLTEITLPIVEEKESFTGWMVFSNDYKSLDEISAHIRLEELTNVHVDYDCVPSTAAKEKFGLLLASGEYPDIVESGTGTTYVQYPGGDDKGIDDGVWRDLTELIPIYCPNYSKYMNITDDVRRQTITDTGRRAAMYMFRCKYGSIEDQTIEIEAEPSWSGMAIRQDWLDNLNLEVPETVDELYDVLVAFKQVGYGGLGLTGNGMVATAVPYILGAWEVTNEFYVESDGKTVGYGPVTDAYREYVTMMRDWYAEGLIYKDFMSNDITTNSAALWANGTLGVYTCGWVSSTDYYYVNGYVEDETFWLTPMVAPVMNKGDQCKITFQSDECYAPMYITTYCDEERVPILLQWADWCYTWDGMVLNSLGIEGEGYTVDPDSEYYYVFTDAIMNCEISGAKLPPFNARILYTLSNYHGLYNWEIQQNLYKQNGQGQYLEGYYTWGEGQTDEIMIPQRASFTSEEGDEFNNIYVDCKSFVEEHTVKFITGELDIDAEWDTFVATLEKMNYQRCLELKQIAYTRYMSK